MIDENEPDAWLHRHHPTAFAIAREIKRVWESVKAEHVEHYTIPLFRRRECEWIEDDDFGTYNTGCHEKFRIYDVTPQENGMRFCCYCGGELTVKEPP